jgi:tRNA pseudouridine55 synthase
MRSREPIRGAHISGILNINKATGMTSHDVVAGVRRISGQKRVGHAGTLDPLATGVLLVCMGQATRVVEYLMQSPKIYRAGIYLGISTDTYDAEGQVIRSGPNDEQINTVSLAQIESSLASFVGRIEQTPPMYSALKHKGQPLYKLARRGLSLPRRPRSVEIEAIDLIEWSPPLLTIEVKCSPGTYIRSLAHDLGELLGCGAHLYCLNRLASGHFTLAGAMTLETVSQVFRQGRWAEVLHPLDEALLAYEAMVVDSETERKIRFGQQVAGPVPSHLPALRRAYSNEGTLIALLSYEARTGLWQPKKVFHPQPVSNSAGG